MSSSASRLECRVPDTIPKTKHTNIHSMHRLWKSPRLHGDGNTLPVTPSRGLSGIRNPKQKEAFEKEYANFLLSELLLDAMSEQNVSVRALSRASGISTSVIQNLRAMQPVNITLKTLNALLSSLGYELVARKGRRCVSLTKQSA